MVAEGPPETVMKEKAVIDAYLGAHQDVDLGVVTGRYEGELTPEAAALVETAHELEEAVEADAATRADEESTAPGTPAPRTEEDK